MNNRGARPATKDAIYTCPMHPEVRQVGPGICPKCGMALEPLLATGDEDTSELRNMTRRFWVSTVLTLPLLVITMSELVPVLDVHRLLSEIVFNWMQASLATPVVLWGGWPFFVRAWVSPPPTLVSPWVPVPTWRCRAPASCWSRAICAGSRKRTC